MLYRMVIVDDEDKIREGLVHTVPWESLGFEVTAFESSLHALDYIGKSDVHVVLTDIKMPLMDGVELVGRIKGLKPGVICVFLSGYRDFEYARSAVSLGVVEYLTKPIHRDKLVALFRRIRHMLDEARQDQDEPEQPTLYYERIVAEVKEYIEEHLPEANLEQAAYLVGLSTGYLSKLFKQKAGSSFSDYLLACKMKKAAHLLLESRMKSYEISELVGYDNPKNFSRSFRQYYGVSPREYREKGGPL